MTRRFAGAVRYTRHGWFAQVWTTGYESTRPYIEHSRSTEFGARVHAWRLARKLNRLERRGLVR